MPFKSIAGTLAQQKNKQKTRFLKNQVHVFVSTTESHQVYRQIIISLGDKLQDEWPLLYQEEAI